MERSEWPTCWVLAKHSFFLQKVENHLKCGCGSTEPILGALFQCEMMFERQSSRDRPQYPSQLRRLANVFYSREVGAKCLSRPQGTYTTVKARENSPEVAEVPNKGWWDEKLELLTWSREGGIFKRRICEMLFPNSANPRSDLCWRWCLIQICTAGTMMVVVLARALQ